MPELILSYHCHLCDRQAVTLIYHPLVRQHVCLPCMREKDPEFFRSVARWFATHGHVKMEGGAPDAGR